MENDSVGDRLLRVLVAVARHGTPVSAKELADNAGQPLSTIYRQLALLKRWGLVSELSPDGGYGPGPVSVQLAWGFDATSHLLSLARPEMEKLAAQTEESVALMALVAGETMCLEMIESQQSLRCSILKGRSLPLLRGASAKALLAFLPEPQCETIIGNQLGQSSEAAHQLRAELALVRSQRYAESLGEVDEGVWGVSVPIFSPRGDLMAGLSLMAPAIRAEKRRQSFIRLAVLTGERITERLLAVH